MEHGSSASFSSITFKILEGGSWKTKSQDRDSQVVKSGNQELPVQSGHPTEDVETSEHIFLLTGYKNTVNDADLVRGSMDQKDMDQEEHEL